MRKVLLSLMAALSLASCGGDSGGKVCKQIGTTLCKKACACRDGGPKCIISQGGFGIEFDSESDCRALFVTFGCSQGDMAAYNDAAACLPLAEAATCMGTGEEASVEFPADPVCETPPTDE